MDNDSMFKPLPPAAMTHQVAHSEPIADAEGWTVLIPVPADAPVSPYTVPNRAAPPIDAEVGSAPQRHPTLHPYRDAQGQLLHYVERRPRPDGGKDIIPWAFCEHTDGRREWRMKALPAVRPLYGLDRLAAAPHAIVLVVEGEKAADAAAALFPGMIAVTSQGGARAAGKTDWSTLAGRRVVFWGDHDADGRRYVIEAARLVRAAGAHQISTVQVPAGFPEKWDVADEPPSGWDRTQLVELLERTLENPDPLAGIDPSSGVSHPFR
jgi:putative DNA primase/helicase